MREILTVRDRGIEALIASLPVEPAEKENARQFAVGLTNSLARWEMRRRTGKVEGGQYD
ncbi:MAG: hypothetical protein IT552_12080 [Sphingomonadaceae bacterium]|nr:hypothetical protein [Sphingomonadaceae bacterium]